MRRADAISALLRGEPSCDEGGRPGRGIDDDVVGEPSCDGGGHRLAGVVKDGKVRWRALNTSEPCGLRRPVGCDGLWSATACG